MRGAGVLEQGEAHMSGSPPWNAFPSGGTRQMQVAGLTSGSQVSGSRDCIYFTFFIFLTFIEAIKGFT